MSAYYNENDEFAAQWLRNLISAGLIAGGDVDDRSITEVKADDIKSYTQCHFFAGIGVWSYALRRAGWSDSRPVWTGSCPCQPFSTAGKGEGFSDDRHLWPVFSRLIGECRPVEIFGEQVASKDADAWIDAVQDDLEGMGYAVGAVPFPSAGVGAPHIRDRLYWMARDLRMGNTRREGLEGHHRHGGDGNESGRDNAESPRPVGAAGGFSRVVFAAECDDEGNCPQCGDDFGDCECIGPTEDNVEYIWIDGELYGKRMANAESTGFAHGRTGTILAKPSATGGKTSAATTSPLNGFWRDADWLLCRDGKWRPVEPIHVKMVDGATSGMGYLCSYPENERGKVSAIVQGVRQNASTEALLIGGARVSVDAETQGILRPCVHGDRDEKTAVQQPKSQPDKGTSRGGGSVLRLPKATPQATCPSCGSRPAQQCAIQLDDVVPFLSPSCSLAELHGDWGTAKALHALSGAICEEGSVQYAPNQVKEVWASLGEDAKNRLRLGFDASRWKVMVPFPLSAGAGNRTNRLKGYGNAINAEAAIAFIEAAMEFAP